jgi:TPR repeat protein
MRMDAMRRLAPLLIAGALLAPGAHADFEAGLAAADRGDYAEALRQWLPLAEQGYPSAQYNVALLYRNGWGTARDLGEAIMWYWAAAAQGDLNAQFDLGGMYARGEGMPPTPVEAWAWLEVAARAGHPGAAAERDRVHATLDAEGREQARLLAGVLWERYGRAP